MENTINQFDPSRARAELLRMFSELSAEALMYVWRPIVYAYYWTDEHNQDLITIDDINRISLISAVAHDSPELVRALDASRCWIQRTEREKSRADA